MVKGIKNKTIQKMGGNSNSKDSFCERSKKAVFGKSQMADGYWVEWRYWRRICEIIKACQSSGRLQNHGRFMIQWRQFFDNRMLAVACCVIPPSFDGTVLDELVISRW
jgi:hypothetical protein